ncbi:tRNA(Ile)-lysidine synthase [Mesorhizobium sp. L-8-10]|nr:tRNA(Ile)-lysidine synthase [Mesorhizobium sp. L-8-10]
MGSAGRCPIYARFPADTASGFISRPSMTAGSDKSFDACFGRLDLTGRRGVVAAVSGGSDSTALLFLLKAALESNASGTKLLAVTIDHGLRPDSAEEAATVARLCGDHGIAHQTLRWEGPKPKTGVQAAAREARYRLLARAAIALGTDVVFSGHTSDDQAETIAMRRRRGAGHGMAGMAPATLYDGKVWILRPLLETSRAALRDYLDTMQIGWIDDPSNRNTAFERIRVRQGGTSGAGDVPSAAAARRAVAGRAGELIASHALLPVPGLIRLAPAFFTVDDREAAVHGFRVLLAVAGGVGHLPDLVRVGALFERVASGSHCATLSRVVVEARRAGVFLRREMRGLPAPVPLIQGMIWDGRFRMEAGDAGEGCIIEPLGPEDVGTGELTSVDEPKSLVRKALAAGPAVRLAGCERKISIAAGPLAAGSAPETPAGAERVLAAATPLLAPWARFLPSFDLPLARAVAALVGAPDIPASPCEGHKKREM